MTRLFLAAGVAALAIAMPASAKPGEHGGGKGGGAATAAPAKGGGNVRVQGRGGGGASHAQSFSRGPSVQMRSVERRGGGGFAAPRQQQRAFAFSDRGHGHGGGAMQVQRQSNRTTRLSRADRRIERSVARPQRIERAQARHIERQQTRANRMVQRQDLRPNRIANDQNRMAQRHDFRANRMAERQNLRTDRLATVENRFAARQQLNANRAQRINQAFNDRIITRDDVRAGRFAQLEGSNAVGYGAGGCPPGLASKGCMPPGQAAKLLGTPLSTAAQFASFGAVPLSARYLYPDTDDYFYRYGDGYMYRVDRQSSLIDALLPLAFGGYSQGSYFPTSYMNSYVPDYYGFNSFYPDSQYDCNRYVYGVVYQLDCGTGYVDNVIPLYASGYGVGQMMPEGYGYYNVPYEYRDMYYDTADSGYWYAPGAIYQYDPSSSMITSVAALLSPGFSIGQQLPYGYDAYNVPYDYRQTYYDTPDAWYRYNNGNIYQVDPTTQLVTAIVASILT